MWPRYLLAMYPELCRFIARLPQAPVATARLAVLNNLAAYIRAEAAVGRAVNVNFICTHNSRRSQLAQVWAQTAACFYGIRANSYSGGVAVTAFDERAVAALSGVGFKISKKDSHANPRYEIRFASDAPPILAWSKLYDDPANPRNGFAAVMTCAGADENCPFIPGAGVRIPLRYDDPKEFDGTAREAAMYAARSQQIAAEMFYVFALINKK